MKTLVEQISIYGHYHSHPVNKWIHFIGIPCIVFSVLLLLSWLHLTIPPYLDISFAWLAIFAVGIYYLILDFKLAAPVIATAIILELIAKWIAHPVPTQTGLIVFLIFFIGGWGAQFIGHAIEGKRPAFMHNLFQMLIAPLFLAAEIAVMQGWRKDLQGKVPQG